MQDIRSCCRTCMKSNVVLMDLFQSLKIEDNETIIISQALMDCTSVQISKNDCLPQNICDQCLNTLQTAYTFRRQAVRAEEEFLQYTSLNSLIKTEDSDDTNFDEAVPFYDVKLEEDGYNCDKCSKTFEDENIYLNHLNICEGDDPKINCHVCGNRYIKKSNLLKHLRQEHNIHRCTKCDIEFSIEQLLIEHLALHGVSSDNDLKRYDCSKCQKSFKSYKSLALHMKKHDSEHVKTENEENQYKCEKCEMAFSKPHSLAMHKKKHKENRTNYVCDHCNKTFQSKNLLRRHMKLHNKIKPFSCTMCPKTYTRQDQFKTHMRSHTNQKSHICPVCSKAFAQISNYNDHVRVHTRETPFLCADCGKGFRNRSNLRQHMFTHTNIKNFSCSLCPKKFTTKGQMLSHMTTHTDAHPFSCDCGARFTKRHSLKKHQRIHLGIRPYVCDTCNKSFTAKDHLKRHARIHTGEKPFRCQHCPRAFRQTNDRNKHERTHDGHSAYKCTVCGMGFRLKKELQSHYPIHYIDGAPPTIAVTKDLSVPAVVVRPTEQDMQTLPGLSNVPPIALSTLPLGDLPALPALPDPDQNTADATITITFNRNGLDKNGLAGDITINITPEKS